MKVRLLRNATLLVESSSTVLLVDPMLGKKGELGPFPYINDTRDNPLVDLPVSSDELAAIIKRVNAVLLTHLHPDHWDFSAQNLIPKNIPIFCQPVDKEAILNAGFENVYEIDEKKNVFDLMLYRTNGKHGIGEIGDLMGTVSGFVIEHQNEKIYLAGDTIWCDDVKNAVEQFQPDKIIVNGGGAQFNIGEHVTMNRDDLSQIYQYYPSADYYVVHLEAVSPIQETRLEIQEFLNDNALNESFKIPDDGEYLF
jgi:L-ascorbate metabolism protein UlaG (beta-lactamase superfamily)